jgi:ubiquinone/menaquinone biosynthesis C-methylase UbiE
MRTVEVNDSYIPAAGQHWALPIYDLLTKLMGVDRVRDVLLEQAGLRPSQRVLDIGCGTGTFAVLVKRVHPDVEVVAIDPDPGALARARRKASRARTSIQFDEGVAGALPYDDGVFDFVFSSFMFHHLQGDQKLHMFREARRVLARGGRFEMVDFAGPDAPGGFVTRRLLQSHQLLSDNAEQRVLALMNDAGLLQPRCTERRRLLIGTAAFYQAFRHE